MKLLPHALTLTALLLAGCADYPLLPDNGGGDNGDGRIHFAVTPPATTEVEMFSRATIPATDPEKNIYTLRIIVFDKNGNRIPDDVFRYYDKTFPADGTVLRGEGITQDATGNYEIDLDQLGVSIFPVDANEGFSLPVLPYNTGSYTPDADGNVGYSYDDTNATVSLNPTECTVWALANIGRWNNSLVGFQSTTSQDTDYTPGQIIDGIQTRDDLRRLYGQRFATDIGENRRFLPMVGTYRAADAHPVVDQTDVIAGKSFDDIFGSGAPVYPSAEYYSEPGTIDLTKPVAIGSPVEIKMDQIVAKVRFNISTQATTETDANGNIVDVHWQFYFDNWTVESLPRYTYIIPHKKDIREYLTNTTYTTAAGISGSWNYYLPTSDDERSHFLHNGSGARDPAGASGDASLDGDWIDTGYTSPSSDFPDPDQASFVYEALEGSNELFYHFYTYGNRCGGRASAPNPANLSGTTESYSDYYDTDGKMLVSDNANSPLYKTLYAPDGASFLVIKGIVRKWVPATGERISKSVVYKIALGGNQTDDYNVYRNTCYTLRITVRGFSQNDLYVTYNADATKYNSSVRQRYGLSLTANYIDSIDAHYDMRYLQLTIDEPNDTYALKLYDDADVPDGYKTDGNITTIINGVVTKKPDWIKVAELRSGTVGDNTDTSGNTIRWITDITDGNEITGITATSKNEHNFAICTSEYVTDADGKVSTEPRVAWLEIKHTYTGKYSDVLESLKNKEKTDTYRYLVQEVNNTDTNQPQAIVYIYLKLVQYPPYQVPCTLTYTDGTGTSVTVSKTLLVERFEEYNLHLDPRTASYSADIADGLPWGWQPYNSTPYDFSIPSKSPQNTVIGTATSETNGHENTQHIVGSSFADGDNQGINYTQYSNHIDYAARYCYDKGDATNRNWYLPSLKEMNAITFYDSPDNTTDINYGTHTTDDVAYWTSTATPAPTEIPRYQELEEARYKGIIRDYPLHTGRSVYYYIIDHIRFYLWRDDNNSDITPDEFNTWWNYKSSDQDNPNSEYYYSKCARASSQGYEWFENYSWSYIEQQSGGSTSTYFNPYTRPTKMKVRACRVAP